MNNTIPEKCMFDDTVQKAMEKWTDVPECYGWLGLSRRAEWSIKGEKVSHANTCRFLQRNYACDTFGRWFVQNGPQRVFVALEYTPRLYGFSKSNGFYAHGEAEMPALLEAFLDEEGNLLLHSQLGLGLVDDRDLSAVSDLIESINDVPLYLKYEGTSHTIKPITKSLAPQNFGYIQNPEQF
jgi:hypothetical protein